MLGLKESLEKEGEIFDGILFPLFPKFISKQHSITPWPNAILWLPLRAEFGKSDSHNIATDKKRLSSIEFEPWWKTSSRMQHDYLENDQVAKQSANNSLEHQIVLFILLINNKQIDKEC